MFVSNKFKFIENVAKCKVLFIEDEICITCNIFLYVCSNYFFSSWLEFEICIQCIFSGSGQFFIFEITSPMIDSKDETWNFNQRQWCLDFMVIDNVLCNVGNIVMFFCFLSRHILYESILGGILIFVGNVVPKYCTKLGDGGAGNT